MAGHSKWAQIKRQKGVNDAKRGAVFTKIGNQIAIAARGGTDPLTNSALAMVIEKAKQANMPKANIEKAIARVADKNAAQLEEIIYEGYGPNGVGFVIETATDNRNRTLPEVKTALTKNGGRFADPGSVLFQFKQKGVLMTAGLTEDQMLEILDAGALDIKDEGEEFVIYTEPREMLAVKAKVEELGVELKQAELEYVADNLIAITDDETAQKILKIMNAIDDLDDVVNVYTNADLN